MSVEVHILYIILVSVKNDLIQFVLTHHVKLHKGLIAIIDSLSKLMSICILQPMHGWTKTLTHVPNCSLSVYSLFARIYPWEEEMSVQLGGNGCHHRLCTNSNKWLNQIGERGLVASTSRSGIVMEKPAASNHEQQQQWAVLKCPRCESSNTKFCYFNNYSLSQPRHFCKACKRYWTRGGTLRNVPVGGGCRRKNKRVKRPSSGTIMDGASCSASTSVSFATNPRPAAQPQIMDRPSSSSATLDHMHSPLLYGMPTNRSDMNDLQFPSTRFNSTTVPTVDTLSRFDHLTGLGGVPVPPFSSGFSFAKEITFQGAVSTSNSLLPSYNSIFGSSSCSASSPTMASFFLNGNGTLKQPHQVTSHLQTLPPFQNQLQQGNGEVLVSAMKTKVEGDKNRLQDWSNVTNQVDQVGLLDPSLYWNSTTPNNAWHDPANAGSSQPPL